MAEAPVTQSFYYPVSPLDRVLITFIVMTGFFMAILDTTIVDIVVPKMMGPLSTDLYGIQWVITAYMTAAAVGLIFVVSLAPRIGYAWTFLSGLTLFTLSSAMCGLAGSLPSMVFWRVMQGLGEAFIAASAQTILLAVYPPERQGLAMGIFGLGVSFAPALGPTLGGFLTEHLSWRWVFYINLPVGVLTLVAGLFFLPRAIGRTGRFEFNPISYIFLTAFTISLLVLLSKGQQLGWFQSTVIGTLAFVSALALVAYLISELLSRKPLLDLSIYLIPEFGLTMAYHFFVLGFSMYQIFYLLPLYYENLKGLTTFQAGLHMLAFASCIGLFSVISGALSDRFKPEYLLVASFFIYSFVSVFLLPRLNYYTPAFTAALYTVPLGMAIGTFFPPLTRITLSNLGPRTGLGVVLMHYQRFIGGSFGTAIATNTLTYRTDFHFQEITGLQNRVLFEKAIQKGTAFLEPFFPSELAIRKAKALMFKVESLYAASYAFQDTFRRTYYFALLGAVFLFILFFRNLYRSYQARREVRA
ncbi:DHA2 family efflux MFS transporter permease subunit [Thermosulfurimonas dismutans]|uniref:Major facilitator family transporter n=1 Tax=Thermosulfurimonas dismutans TaxID=999894 RepID=A0A179D4Q7_9BACT|nr:DHA2 family efflux MFS transporter permease subunit [Thermosulfurimonas dismutans]OAQ20953.1 major facilitator family transporter [Thermosulfurimonas dismutans]